MMPERMRSQLGHMKTDAKLFNDIVQGTWSQRLAWILLVVFTGAGRVPSAW